jgi:CMP-N-acetylneuraminic acid synthetase
MVKLIALVPMRHHSQRVPGKNYRDLAGKPLFHYILETLIEVSELNGIVVDTDSPLIKSGIEELFPTVQVLDRQKDLCADDVSMNQIINYDISVIEADYYLQTHCTNPLLTHQTISKAIQTFLGNRNLYDSLFSVTWLQTRFYDKDGNSLNHDPEELIQTQDLPPFYAENSCIYLFSKDSFKIKQHRVGTKPYLFEISPEEALDIDTILDFNIVDCLIRNSRK